MLTPHKPSTRMRRAVNARDLDVTITRSSGKTPPKKVARSRKSGRTAIYNRRP